MRTFSKVLAIVLCVAMLFTTAFASGLQASFVDFQTDGSNVTARVNLRNNDSADALSGKVIVASYDADGNLVATGESDKIEVAKGAETIVSASVAANGADYKAFVWNDAVAPNSKHAVAGATGNNDFTADTGVDNGKVSVNEVATTAITTNVVPELVLYSPFRGRTEDDSSEATGGRVTVSTYPGNSKQYHEVYYADPSLEGYDFFVFSPGNIDYSAQGSSLLTFSIVKDAEIIILSSSDAQEFEGFELIKAEDAAADGETFAKGRYMVREFADALNAIGIRPTYAIAKAYNADKEGYYEEVIKPVYEAASDDAKSTFDTNWTKFNNGGSYSTPGDYIAMYTKTVTLDGADSAEVVIPAETTGNISRNLIVLVKPLNNGNVADGSSFTPITKAGTADAVPALKGVEIDGTYVSIDKFTDNAYSYKLNALGDCILPVVKGITTDNALYASTDYDIAADAKSAVITVTVKNLYTNAAPAVYTINVTIDIPADAYDIVNLNGTTIVDNTNVLANKVVTEGLDSTECPIAERPTSVVSGMTYAQYIAYINEYYGYKEGDENYITGTGSVAGTEVIGTNKNFAYANNFAIDSQMGSESNRRLISYISPRYANFKSLYRLYGTIALNQLSNTSDQGWFTGALYLGSDRESSGGYNVKAKTDALPAVPWFTTVMQKKGTVYVAAYSEVPVLAANGYKLMSSDVEAYYGRDTSNSDAKVAGPKYIYYKVFNEGETVEIFNPANAYTTGYPLVWFFSAGIPTTYEYTYGKMSSGAAATAYNSTVTNGVLYKNLFADVEASSNTTGNQWVSDFAPLGAGQRIESVEDASLLGCDYFTFSINNRSKIGNVGGNLLEFKVDKDCEVLILTKAQDSAAVFGDFTKNTNHATVTGMFPQNNFLMTLKAMGLPTTDISMDMVHDLYASSGLTFSQICDKWLSSYFPYATKEELLVAVNAAAKSTSIGTELFASVDSVSSVAGGDGNHPYTVSHTKSFSAGDTVAIPDPTGDTDFDRPIIVVVKPKLGSTITDHVTDFQIVASTGAGSFILGPGANAMISSAFSDRLMHNYSTEPGVADAASAYSINNQRIFAVTDEVLGLENCYYLKYVNQASVDSVLKNTANAEWIGGTDKADLAWMTFTVTQDCDIIIVPSAETPKFVTREENGWSKNTLSDYAFTLTRKTDNSGGTYQDYTSKSQKVMYVKSYSAGDTVTLYNGNNGTTTMTYDQLPYFAFVRVK